MAVKREPIPVETINGLKAVRSSGKVNMLDRPGVLRLLAKINPVAHDWVEANPGRYMEALLAMGNALGVNE